MLACSVLAGSTVEPHWQQLRCSGAHSRQHVTRPTFLQALKQLDPSMTAPAKLLGLSCVETRLRTWMLILRWHACVTCTGFLILVRGLGDSWLGRCIM